MPLPCHRIEVIARFLLDNLPGAEVGLLGLLPRGKPTGYDYEQPSVFTASINALNDRIRWAW